MLNSRKFPRIKAKQRGASAVEFGIIAVLFFTLFFGIIEFGRVFYLYNTVQEVTRCAARQAAVTWKGDNGGKWSEVTTGIRQACLFGADELVAGWEIQKANVRLRALNLAGSEAEPNSLDENFSNCAVCPTNAYDVAKSECINCIRFVEASIQSCNQQGNNYNCQPISYQPMFGMMIPVSGVGIPNSTVRMPAESLGYY